MVENEQYLGVKLIPSSLSDGEQQEAGIGVQQVCSKVNGGVGMKVTSLLIRDLVYQRRFPTQKAKLLTL